MALLTKLVALAALALATARPYQATRYLALGDSTGVGVGAREDGGYVARVFTRLRQDDPSATLVNACAAGARVRDVLSSQLERGLAFRPTLITLGVGINDVTRGTPLEDLERVYRELADRLAASGARVVVVNAPDLSLSPLASEPGIQFFIRARTRKLNEVIARIAAQHGFALVDLFDASERALPGHPELFSADHFHPSPAGYDVWADAMWPAVEHAVRQRFR